MHKHFVLKIREASFTYSLRENTVAQETALDGIYVIRTNLPIAPVRVIGNKEGWVEGLECIEMELGEPDASGRRRPVPKEGSNFVLEVDCSIPAIGTSANPLLAQTTPDMEFTRKGYIRVEGEETGRSTKKGVFAGGDIVTGAATVILAAGAGRNAAAAIDKYLADGEWWDPNAPPPPPPPPEPEKKPATAPAK